MQRSSVVHCTGLVLALAIVSACAGVTRGATDVNLARARTTSHDGALLFAKECAPCHGQRGESAGNAPFILGEGALPEYPRERNITANPAAGDPAALRLEARSRPLGAPWRDPFRTAQDLYNYVSRNMPLPEKMAGTLKPEEYWAILNFMLVAHGVSVPESGVNRENAKTVKLRVTAP
jgi:hypothetical protein